MCSIYRIVPGKRPSPRKGPPPNFDSSVVCEVLRVTAHHAIFLRGDSKGSQFELTQTVSINFRRHCIRQQGLQTPVVASFAAFFACSTKFARTASDERCEALSTRLQLSLLPRWPRLPKKGSTGEGTTRDNSVAPVSYLRIRSGRLHGHSWTIQAPPPCKGPPPIFRAWAASVHGRLPGILRYLQRIINGDGR